jgi:hypothetical protein
MTLHDRITDDEPEADEWCLDANCHRDSHDHSRRDGYHSD